MATLRGKVPVGSAQWILNERRQANELVEQEVEEFTYSVRNEVEWLNEHMAEIYGANQLHVTDIFKTPGKLRGKTPRTARKKNALQERAPLTDIFAPNVQPAQSPSRNTQFYKQIGQIQIAQGSDARRPQSSPQKQRYVASGKENTDSGYHGSQDDEMEVDLIQPLPASQKPNVPSQQILESTSVPSRAATEDQESFVSAQEKLGSKSNSMDNLREDDEATIMHGGDNKITTKEDDVMTEEPKPSPVRVQPSQAARSADANVIVHEDAADPMELDDAPSEASSPEKPLLRKSSLTFAALPAREPLAGKQSIGNRVSRTSHIEQYKSSTIGRASQIGRTTGGKSLGATHVLATDENDQSEVEVVRPALSRIESETTKLHNKTSTQRLHDAITKLGQTNPRTSKSVPNFSAVTHPPLTNAGEKAGPAEPPALPLKDHIPTARVVVPEDDDEDDWITAPVKFTEPAHQQARSIPQPDSAPKHEPSELRVPQHRSNRSASPPKPPMYGHVKSISASAMPSPTKSAMAVQTKHQKAISVSNPNLASGSDSTTPAGSPARKFADGPLSASKSKLYSVLKSAKNIFASSAVVSAQAKSEVLSPNRSRINLPEAAERPPMSPNPDVRPSPALFPSLTADQEERATSASPPKPEGRKTRSSSEREKDGKRKEKEAKEKQRNADELDKAREKERQKATAHMAQKTKPAPKDPESADDMPPPPPPKSLLPQTKAREPRRVLKPSKEILNKSTGPPRPITIQVNSQRFGNHVPSNTTLSASLSDSLPPPPPPKTDQQTTASKAGSSTALNSQSSNSSLKASSSSQTGRPKALEAAARKKELEEKAARRKAEQKRELEQRRAAKLEEERKAKEEEQKRAAEAKKAAQRKAEEARRLEQQRREAARPASRQGHHDLPNPQERNQPASGYQRADVGGARPLNLMKSIQDASKTIIPVNPAKPAKRPLPPDHDEEPVTRPGMQRNPASYQLDPKRRKPSEEDENSEPRRSVMQAPPIRHSIIRKEPNKFPHGYGPASQQSSHASNIFKSSVTSQSHQGHGQPSVKLPTGHPHNYANARIPFADATNTAPSSSTLTANTQTYKTPLRPEGPSKMAAASAAKSSPYYPPGESIALPEIATDSEDEDSDNDFAAPSWVASPFLNEALNQQQLIDPETVFGPVAELRMDEIFRNKERQKRWRERTSSALWTSDKLTEEERKRDREGRERLMKEGGWSFNTVQE